MKWEMVKAGLSPVKRSHYRALWLPDLYALRTLRLNFPEQGQPKPQSTVLPHLNSRQVVSCFCVPIPQRICNVRGFTSQWTSECARSLFC